MGHDVLWEMHKWWIQCWNPGAIADTRIVGGGGGVGGVGRGSWYVQCNISHTIDSLESPIPFNAAKQATLQCVKKKKALNAASLCVTTQWFSPRSIAWHSKGHFVKDQYLQSWWGWQGYGHYWMGPKINLPLKKYPFWDQYKYNLFLQFYFSQ